MADTGSAGAGVDTAAAATATTMSRATTGRGSGAGGRDFGAVVLIGLVVFGVASAEGPSHAAKAYKMLFTTERWE